MSVLIVSVSAVLTYVRDEVFAQGQYNSQGGLPTINVPIQTQTPKWLVSFEKLEDQNVEQVIIVDPETQRIGVYRVGLDNGEIRLANIRHINADLQLRAYDCVDVYPQQIEKHFQTKSSP